MFGTRKDGSPNNLAQNRCLSGRSIFQNGVNALSKICFFFLDNRFFFQKAQILGSLNDMFCSNFNSVWYKHLLRNVRRIFGLPMSEQATVARKRFTVNLPQKLIFRSDILITIADADVGSRKSLHVIFWYVLRQHANEI